LILITGSSGFVGTNVTEYLLSKKEEVTGLDLAPPQKNFDKDSFLFHRCDLTSQMAVDQAFKKFKPQHVIHFAFVTYRESLYHEFLKDAQITLNMLEAALKTDVERFILMSSSTIYGLRTEDQPVKEDEKPNPKGVYGKAKLAAEMMARQYFESQNLPIVIVRGFEIYGPHLTTPSIVKRLLERAAQKEPLQIYCYGKQKTDFTYAEDLARAMELLLHEKKAIGDIFNAGFGKPHTYEDLGNIIKQLIPCKVELLPPRAKEKPFYLYTDAQKLKSLGFKPKWDLEEGMKKTVDWMLAKHG
jgi:nucleoside-diphosphate-sugar epimerase